MTTSQRLKLAVIAALNSNPPISGISIVDANSRNDIDLPLIAVDIESVSAHSTALPGVERASVSVTLRAHIGDENPTETDDWIDSIEAVLADEETIQEAGEPLLKIFSFVYEGSVQNWDENILQITFSAESLCARLP